MINLTKPKSSLHRPTVKIVMCLFVTNFLSYVFAKYYLNWFTVGKVITKQVCLLITWQRWRSHHSILRSPILGLHANLMALSFTEPELWAIEVLHCGNRNFRPFGLLRPWSRSDDLHMYKLDPYCLEELYRMCKYELPTSRLSKVTVWHIHTYIHTYIHTESTKIMKHACRFAGDQ